MESLIRVTDQSGRPWLLPVTHDPHLIPEGGHSPEPVPLHIAESMFGPLHLTAMKVIERDPWGEDE